MATLDEYLNSKNNPPQQFTRDDLRQMDPEQIDEARARGHLNDLLAGRDPSAAAAATAEAERKEALRRKYLLGVGDGDAK